LIIGALFSLFYGFRAVEIFQRADSKIKYPKYRISWWIHQRWINFIGSMIGWIALYLELLNFDRIGWNVIASNLTLSDFALLVIALLGIMGFLPKALWNLAGAIYALLGKM
jgi:hypothetical protein